MKKLFAKIVSLTLAVVMSMFLFNGCGLVTVNEERNMAQDIAIVSLDDALTKTFKKRELQVQFVNQGAYYVQYMGYTTKETYELLLDEMIKQEVLYQQSVLALTGPTTVLGNEDKGLFLQASEVAENSRTAKEKVLTTPNHLGEAMTSVVKSDAYDKFLTEYEFVSARFKVLYAVRSLIDGYVDSEEEEHNHQFEEYAGTARATLAAVVEEDGNEYELKNEEKYSKVDKEGEFYKSHKNLVEKADLNVNIDAYDNKYDLAMAVYNAYINNFEITSREDKKAVNKLIKDLKDYGFISAVEAQGKAPSTVDDFLNLTYVKENLESQYKSLIISKYELALTNQQEKIMDKDNGAGLYNAYLNLYNSQKAIYSHDYTAYEAALENATEISQVVYHPDFGDKYGQVLNLLIGFNDAQNDIINTAQENTNLNDEQKRYIRDTLLKNLIAKDMRTSWVDANYGNYDATTGNVTFKSKYCKTESLSQFIGKVYGATEYVSHDEYDNEVTSYHFEAVKSTSLTFSEFFNGKQDVFAGVTGIMGFNAFASTINGHNGVLSNVEEVNALGTVLNDATLEKYHDLLYAFSTDDGSLSEGYGYLYSPKTSPTKYVSEFADAAKRLINKGVGAYEIVATEFGYHVMLCARVIEPTVSPITQQAFLDTLADENSVAYNFKEYQKSRVVYDNISKITTAFINANNVEPKVQKILAAYEDLLEE